jgi:hypothetical protein
MKSMAGGKKSNEDNKSWIFQLGDASGGLEHIAPLHAGLGGAANSSRLAHH